MNELALFAGAGGGILGGKLLGWRTVCACELDEYARAVLIERQNDGSLPPFPIWDDVRTFDGKPWRGVVDIITGGFPCQDISAAGSGAGIAGARSGLWSEMARIIREVGPRHVLVENSPILTSRGLGRVVGDLAAMGYDARWGVLGAIHAGAPHRRERIWLLANARCRRRCESHAGKMEQPWRAQAERASDAADANGYALRQQSESECWREGASLARYDGVAEPVADTERGRQQTIREHRKLASPQGRKGNDGHTSPGASDGGGWWNAEPDLGRVADGVAARVDRLRAIGNGQVPAVVRLAWDTLTRDL